MSIVCFDTLFYDKILTHNSISDGFQKWAKAQTITSKNMWLVPINYISPRHWVLLLVIQSERTMVLFDSLHGIPPQMIVNAMCNFIEIESKRKISWSEWTLYAPTDIPGQIGRDGVFRGNCGVHVCCWALTIATCSNISFTEDDMSSARIALANILHHSKTDLNRMRLTNKKRKLLCLDAQQTEKSTAITASTEESIMVKREPPMNFDTTVEFCAILHLLNPYSYKSNLRKPKDSH